MLSITYSGQFPGFFHFSHEIGLLFRRRQAAVKEQVGCFQVRRPVGQVFDPEAPVDQDAFFPVNKADFRVGHGHSPQADVFHTHALSHFQLLFAKSGGSKNFLNPPRPEMYIFVSGGPGRPNPVRSGGAFRGKSFYAYFVWIIGFNPVQFKVWGRSKGP